MAMRMANNMTMKRANVADFKNHLSAYLAAVEQGEEVEVRKRNVPDARLVPIKREKPNRTRLGCGRGTVTVRGDLTEPMIPEADWDMLRDQEDAGPS